MDAIKKCPQCNCHFSPHNESQIYCCRACRMKAEAALPKATSKTGAKIIIGINNDLAQTMAELEWLNCKHEQAQTVISGLSEFAAMLASLHGDALSVCNELRDTIDEQQATILKQAGQIAQLQGQLAEASLEKPAPQGRYAVHQNAITVKEPNHANLSFNVCKRLRLKQVSALPCGKRTKCFLPDRCENTPEDACYEAADALEKELALIVTGAPMGMARKTRFADALQGE